MREQGYWQTISRLHAAEINRVRELMDIAFSRGATSSKASEDKVVFPLLVSCRDIVEEILFSVKDGFGRAALRSTRTMYECIVAARYINLYPELAEDFLALFHVEWAKVYQDIPAQFRDPEVDSAIRARVTKYAAGRRIGLRDLKWSDAEVAGMAKEAGALAELHSLAFTLSSAYIHPGAQFLISQISMSSDGVFHVGEKNEDVESAFALRSSHDLLMNAVDLRIKYAPSKELRSLFEVCKADFENLWGYDPHL